MLLRKNQKVTRYVLLGDIAKVEGWRDVVRGRLEEMHFQDDGPVEAERCGFVDPWHLSTVTFADHNRWLFEPYLVFGFRIDRRTLPKNLFDAVLQQKLAAWCADRGLERAPAAIRAEFKEDLKKEWLKRVLPKVKHLQIVLDVSNGGAHLFGNVSETDSDLVRKWTYRLLGCKLVPWAQGRFAEGSKDPLVLLLERAAMLGPLRDTVSDDEGEA